MKGQVASLAEIYRDSEKVDPLVCWVWSGCTPTARTMSSSTTSYRVAAAVGDQVCQVGVGVAVAQDVSIAIRSAIKKAKEAVAPVRKGYYYGIDGVGRMAAAILYLAGIEDVHYHVEGPRDSKINLFEAIFDALKQQYGRVLPCDWAAPGAGPAVAATRADDEDDDAENEDEEKEETTATTRGGGEAQAKDDAHEVEGEESEGDEEEQNWVEVHYPKRRRKPKAKPPHITDAGDDVVAVAVANNKAEAQALAE
ncbi:uncharacterized protein ACA1_074850 [Acanthamoeba castellanii str. Neff]|uniref:S5 DRBM domain-containing protein n=1 Tax=Acanthamoeba castellanii (strain ATCC 30010 / Neff) TaxID=1257118 RepID=L8HGT0_ACACF|nr:uncharacterized protein ACA1_074850 [Acanthamoeba castellanii str. Neff]ELR23918.1 hypothetical protein ACA1_074850 [Acanthamoeba castellanii str. Neff]